MTYLIFESQEVIIQLFRVRLEVTQRHRHILLTKKAEVDTIRRPHEHSSKRGLLRAQTYSILGNIELSVPISNVGDSHH